MEASDSSANEVEAGDSVGALPQTTSRNKPKPGYKREMSINRGKLFRNSNAVHLDVKSTFTSEAIIGVVAFLPITIYCIAYSGMLFGLQVYEELNKHQEAAYWLSRVGWLTLFVLYVFDYSYWRSGRPAVIKRIVITFAFVGFSAGWIMATRDYPLSLIHI